MLRNLPLILFLLTCTYPYTNSTPLEFDIGIITTTSANTDKFLIFADYRGYDIFRLSQSVYVLKAVIGSPAQTFVFMLDTSSYVTWVAEISARGGDFDYKTKYVPYKSKYYSSEGHEKYLKYDGHTIKGYEIYDTITFEGQNTNQPMKFVGATSGDVRNTQDFDGVIGLGRVYNENTEDPEFSFVKRQLLFRKKQVFSFKPKSSQRSSFFIGDYHDDFLRKEYAKCEVPTDLTNSWGCKMSHIFIGPTITQKSFKADSLPLDIGIMITSGAEGITAPLSTWEYFEAKYFKQLIEKKTCEKISAQGKIAVSCLKSFNPNRLPPLYIVVNGYALQISATNLFVKDRKPFLDKAIFVVIFDESYKYLKVGQPLFYENHILFDQDNNLIGFSGNYKEISKLEEGKDEKKEEDKNKKDEQENDYDKNYYTDKAIMVLLIIVAVIVVIGMIIYCIARKRRLAAQQQIGYRSSNLL
jgi:hypothetical protein